MPVGEPFLRMGTRGIDPDDWLKFDDHTNDELALRASLLAEHPDHAELLPGNDDALAELIELVAARTNGPLRPGPQVLGVRSELANLAVTVPEDLLIMVRGDEDWTLAGGVLLFPDQWKLADKIGRSMAGIHEPTDGYDELLERKVDQFFDRLKTGRLVRRRNWFIHDEPVHFLDQHISQVAFDNPDHAASLWVRSERQTLRRLDRSDAIIFTVKTQFAPLVELRSRPDLAEQMAAFIEHASPRSLDNKDIAGRSDAIVEFLRS